jgi:hypothetical protein
MTDFEAETELNARLADRCCWLWSIPAFFVWPREHIALLVKWWRS